MPVLGTSLTVPYTFERCDAFLRREHTRIHRGIWKPDDDADADQYGEHAKEQEDYLVGQKNVAFIERNAVGDEATKYLR